MYLVKFADALNKNSIVTMIPDAFRKHGKEISLYVETLIAHTITYLISQNECITDEPPTHTNSSSTKLIRLS